MLSFGWTYEFLKWKGSSTVKWTCFVAESESGWLAVLTVFNDKDRGTGTRILSALIDGHLNIADVLVDDSAQDDVIEAIFRFAVEHYPKTSYLVLPRVASYSKTMDFAQRRAGFGILVRGQAGDGCYLAPVSDLDAYEKLLSKKFKATLARAGRKVSELGDMELEVISDCQEVGEHLRRFARLEESGWKGRAGTSLNSHAGLFSFYENALEKLAEQGYVEWHFLKSGEIDLATQLAFRVKSRLIIWKLGYDESQRKLSPGNLLTQNLIRWESARENPVEIDMTTNQNWHRDWRLSSRPYYQLRIYNKKTLGGLATYYRDKIIIYASQIVWLRNAYNRIRR
jgi:hypothetical protein